MNLFPDESERQRQFPVCRTQKFFSHAAVTAFPACVADAMCAYTRQCCEMPQEFGEVLRDIRETRQLCANFIGASAEEIALLGPTSLGLSLFANGLPWEPGDEVLCYAGDYPANVYPWLDLRRKGVEVRMLNPPQMGKITPEFIEASLTPRTKLVALSSCHFLSGYRMDFDLIGQLLHSRGILFSLDAIQTLGAFPLHVKHVDFLSADAHKWMLGPMAIGIVYVKAEHHERCRPTLLGAWNIHSPNFIAQEEIQFVSSAQRYEPGVLNTAGIYGMKAAIEMLMSFGMERVAARIMELKAHLANGLESRGYEILGPSNGPAASGITTFHHQGRNMAELHSALEKSGISASLRHDREKRAYLRFSPHFYNTEAELDAALALL